MKKQYYIIIILILLIITGSFYWFEFRPTSIRKNCYALANEEKETALMADNNAIMNGIEVTKRANYDKIFDDEYKNCLLKNAVKE